jgi:hypothetical protein
MTKERKIYFAETPLKKHNNKVVNRPGRSAIEVKREPF